MGATSGIDPNLLHGLLLAMAAVAAFTDVRRGEIPNWLTLPALLVAPLVHGWVDGTQGLLGSLIGLLGCSVVPLLIWYRQGMAGGDVKLFAAMGAVGGIYVGLEVEFLSLVIASIYAIGQLTWNGKLASSLGNSLFLGLNPILPRKYKRSVPPELMHRIRLGAAILVGTAIALAGHHRELWS